MHRLSAQVERLLELALEEDLSLGDATSEATLDPRATGQGSFLAKEDLVLAGTAVAVRVFERLGATCRFERQDGEPVRSGEVVGTARGTVAALLAAERTALNFLQRLSGVATATRRCVEALAAGGGRTRLLDTRKTTPGWRLLEKEAVRAGGGTNHRLSLGDGILIKDNHVAACGGRGRGGPARARPGRGPAPDRGRGGGPARPRRRHRRRGGHRAARQHGRRRHGRGRAARGGARAPRGQRQHDPGAAAAGGRDRGRLRVDGSNHPQCDGPWTSRSSSGERRTRRGTAEGPGGTAGGAGEGTGG